MDKPASAAGLYSLVNILKWYLWHLKYVQYTVRC